MSRILISTAIGAAVAFALVALPALAVLRPDAESTGGAATAVASHFHAEWTVRASGQGRGCTLARPNLPTGVPFQIESILVSLFGASPAHAPRVALNLTKKLTATTDLDFEIGVPMHTTNPYGYATGLVSPGPLLVRRTGSIDSAAVGDIFDIVFCVTRGSREGTVIARGVLVGVLNPT